jgi:hypothetical protein
MANARRRRRGRPETSPEFACPRAVCLLQHVARCTGVYDTRTFRNEPSGALERRAGTSVVVRRVAGIHHGPGVDHASPDQIMACFFLNQALSSGSTEVKSAIMIRLSLARNVAQSLLSEECGSNHKIDCTSIGRSSNVFVERFHSDHS